MISWHHQDMDEPRISEKEAEVYSKLLTRGFRDTFSRNGMFPDLIARVKLYPWGMVLTIKTQARDGKHPYQGFIGSKDATVENLQKCLVNICADMIEHETGLSPDDPVLWETSFKCARKVEELE